MARYKLTIAYDGSQYKGWQVQPNGDSIQAILQSKLELVLRHPIQLTGAGRTDAGVHAYGQTAHFDTENAIDYYRFLHSVNSLLPKDIRVSQMEQVEHDFHVRYSAKRKIYRYCISIGKIQNPLRRFYCHHHPQSLDIDKLRKGAERLLGTHDFKGFANSANTGAASYDSVRTLYRVDIVETLLEEIWIEFEGNGFLYKMVRNIVGTLLEIGSGKTDLQVIDQIFCSKDRSLGGQTAPPHGLCLVSIDYK